MNPRKMLKGSIHLTVIISLIVLALGSVTAVFFVNLNKTSEQSEQAAKETVISEPKPALQDMYNYYLAQIKNSSAKSIIQKMVDDGRVASGFKVSSTKDPLLCVNEDIPNSVNVSLLNKSDTAASLHVVKVYSNVSTSQANIIVSLKATDAGGWQISEVECP